VRLASVSDRIHAAGGEVIAISVDNDERQAAMFRRWPTPSVRYVSDPGGDTYLRALDLFDPNERDGIALPAILVLDPAGNEVFAHRGRDFADRTHDEDVSAALEALRLDPLDPPEGGPVADVDVDQRGAFQPGTMIPYFRGNRFAAVAIGLRAEGDEARSLAREHRLMCDATLEAWNAVKPS
jgi:hypothetical protein